MICREWFKMIVWGCILGKKGLKIYGLKKFCFCGGDWAYFE